MVTDLDAVFFQYGQKQVCEMIIITHMQLSLMFFRLLSLVASRDIRTGRPGCPQECSPGLSRHSRETEVEALYLEVL